MISQYNFNKKKRREVFDYNYEVMNFDTKYLYGNHWVGIDIDTVQKMNIRTICSATSRLDGMPCIQQKDFLLAKNINKEPQFNKYLFQSASGIPQWNYIYECPYNEGTDYVIVCEGIEMALWLAQYNINCVIAMGTYLYCSQKKQFDHYKDIYVIGDDDVAGETMILRYKQKFGDRLKQSYKLQKGKEEDLANELRKLL